MLTESVVIVGSILLAFFIDASWDARVERERTAELLHALEEEWAAELVKMDEALGRSQASLAAHTSIASYQRDGQSIPRDSVAGLLNTLILGTSTYKPSLAALNSLLLSELSGVDDLDLRAAIAAWPGALEEPLPEQLRLMELGFDLVDLFTDLAVSRSNWPPSGPESSESPFFMQNWGIDGAEFANEAIRAASVRNHLMDVRFVQGSYANQLATVRELLAANLDLLRHSLKEY